MAASSSEADPQKSVAAVKSDSVPVAEMARSAIVASSSPTRGDATGTPAVRFAQQPDVLVATVQHQQSSAQQEQQDLGQFSQARTGNNTTPSAAPATSEPAGAKAVFDLQGSQTTGVGHGMLATALQHQVTVQDLQQLPLEKAAAQPPVMQQVVDQLAGREIKQGTNQITLNLSPEHLGNIQVNLKLDNQQVRVEIVAEHRAVRDALLQQVDQLKESLSRQHITMESFDATTAGNGGLAQQQHNAWRQTASERRPLYQGQQGSTTATVAAVTGMDGPVQYFAPQYQSTLDVRF